MTYYCRPREKENVYLQFFAIVIIFSCSVVKIWATKQEGDALWINIFLSFFYIWEVAYKVATSFFLLVNALSVTFFLRRLLLIGMRNYYPSFLYLFFCFLFPDIVTLWGMLTGALFIWVLFPILFDITEENAQRKACMYGLCCGLLSLIAAPFILFLFFLYAILIWEKLYRVRLFIMPIIGATIPYIYLLSGFYLSNQGDILCEFGNVLQSQIRIGLFGLTVWENMTVMSSILLVIAIALGVVSFFKILYKSGTVIIYKRKKYHAFLFLLFLQFLFTIFFYIPYHLFVQVLLILFSILLFLFLSYLKRKRIYIILFILLFLFAFINNFV